MIGAPKKFKNWPRPLFRPITDHACHQKPNPSRKTVPLNEYMIAQVSTYLLMWVSSCSCGYIVSYVSIKLFMLKCVHSWSFSMHIAENRSFFSLTDIFILIQCFGMYGKCSKYSIVLLLQKHTNVYEYIILLYDIWHQCICR